MIDQRNRVAGRIGNRPEHLPRRVQQAFGAELFADERDTRRNLPRNLRLARQYTDFALKVYEDFFRD
jgi:hypothetical protein|nr:hypothetical protein [Thiocapsa sp. KS1]